MRKNAQSDNVSLLTKIFKADHDAICKSLNDTFATKGIFGKKVPFKIKKSSKFEIGIYMLFRLDVMMRGKQQENIRHILFDSCMNSILPSKASRFIDLVYHRQDVYSEIYNRIIDSKGTWADYKMECDDWLINAILYSQNDYNKMTVKINRLVITGFSIHQDIKLALSSIEISHLVYFDCMLKHIFADNDDFTLLSQEVFLKRWKAGLDEASAIVKADTDGFGKEK